MARVAYLDCPAGISGDMCLGALVDAGVPLAYLQSVVAQLGLGAAVSLEATKVWRCGQIATKVKVMIPTVALTDASMPPSGHSHHRHLPEIEAMIRQGNFEPMVENWSLNTFRHLAMAEGAVHGISPEAVHFHEVGALDAIVDIVATAAGFAWLGVEKIFCSALPTGGGYVRCDHGLMPVPAPATLKLYQQHQVPIFSNGIEKELVTPTGAALAVTLSEGFGAVPKCQITEVGIGAGSHDLPIPNILRLWVGVMVAEEAVFVNAVPPLDYLDHDLHHHHNHHKDDQHGGLNHSHHHESDHTHHSHSHHHGQSASEPETTATIATETTVKKTVMVHH